MFRQKAKKDKRPVVYLIVEGRNKTERNYLFHFKNRDKFNLYIVGSEATDPESMIKKGADIYRKNDLNDEEGDRVFCLIDLDLSAEKYKKVVDMLKKNKYKQVKVIFSNPCFEVWLLYHFTAYPRPEKCSKDVKKQVKTYIKNYEENYSGYEIIGIYDKFLIAINNADNRNSLYEDDIPIYDRNPYTEVQNLIDLFNEYNNKQDK